MSLKTLIQSIGDFFERLFNNTKDDFNELPPHQQEDIIKGVNISEIIKNGYKKGKVTLIQEISQVTGVSEEVADAVILHVLQSLGINVTETQAGLDKLADRIENTVTDDGWNGLWDSAAKFAASWMSTGSLNWMTLGLGVVEFAYQHFIKKVE